MIVAAFVMGIVALTRNKATNETLVNAKLEQPSTVGGTPTIPVSGSAGNFSSPCITAGSNDTSGTIGTASTATVTNVTFSKAYTTVPQAVLITPANQAAAVQVAYVLNITTTGFQFNVNGTGAGGGSGPGVQYYYLVL